MRTGVALTFLFAAPSALASGNIETGMLDMSVDYTWLNTSPGQEVTGGIIFTLDGVSIETGDVPYTGSGTIVRGGWGNDYCWQGLFTTTDGGSGTYYTFGWNGGGGNHRQRIFLTYATTGAVYEGSVPKNSNASTLWDGTMSLPSNTDWTGIWSETAPAVLVALSSPSGKSNAKASTTTMRPLRVFAPSASPGRAAAEADALMAEIGDGFYRR